MQHVFFSPEKSSLFHLDSVSGPFSSLLSPSHGPYEALRSESWDRGLAGSYDRWGFGLTPLDWAVLVAHVYTLFTRSLFTSSFVFSLGSSRESLTVCPPFDGLLRRTRSIQRRHLAELMGILLVIHAAMLGPS